MQMVRHIENFVERPDNQRTIKRTKYRVTQEMLPRYYPQRDTK